MIDRTFSIRITRVLVFYIVCIVSAIPAIVTTIGIITQFSRNSFETFGGILLLGSGYLLTLAAFVITGILVPIYISKLNKISDWTNRLLLSLLLLNCGMTFLYLPVLKLALYIKQFVTGK